MQLSEYIDQLADAWCRTTGRTPVALGGTVVNDGKFMARMRAGGRLTTETFEAFLAFFRDGANWPDNLIPCDAADLLDRLENIATEERASTGTSVEVSREASLDFARDERGVAA